MYMSQQRIEMVTQRTTYLKNGGCILLVCRYNTSLKSNGEEMSFIRLYMKLIIRMDLEQ